MTQSPLTAAGLLRVVLTLLGGTTFARSAITFTDIRLWAGTTPGEGVHEAAMVVDFRDGSPGLVWGYRWPAGEARSGLDMLNAILGANPSLTVDSPFFPGAISWESRTRSYSDNGTPANYLDDHYWGYWVNNEVYYHPTDYTLNSHAVPPSLTAVPLGNPFGAGHWVESSTGSAARPLVNGSWDGWAYGAFGTLPGEPVAAIPEPSGLWLGLAAATAGLLSRRRNPAARRHVSA